jgi:hypothetical protein
LANAYKLAGDRLIETALKNEEVQELFYPAIYNYRHAIELYLKALSGRQEQKHDLAWLYSEFVKTLKRRFDQTQPDWFENLIATFHDFDPYGTIFRYGGNTEKGEVFVDYHRLQKHMAWAGEGFRNIRHASGLPDADY